MITSMDKIVEVLEGPFNLLCDDCLSQLADVKPRQQVNMICRSLAKAGKLQRRKALCPKCGGRKILNKLDIPEETLPPGPLKGSEVRETSAQYASETRNQGAKLDSIRRDMIKICNELDSEQETYPQEKHPLPFGERLSSIAGSGRIPESKFIVMRMLNAMRNAVVYRGCLLENQDQELVDKAHQNLLEWWNKKRRS
jgi:hypothetical protein